MKTFVVVATLALAACISAAGSHGSEPDEVRIRQLIAEEQTAWNRANAKLYAAHFQDDGGFTNVLGNVYYGRQAFEERHAQLFSTAFAGSKIEMNVRKVRFLRPDVAIVDVDTQMTGYKALPPGVRSDANGVVYTRLQQVMVKEKNDDWWIASYHNIDVKF
jgi:uncharacterized protein (TIGR02246 family)